MTVFVVIALIAFENEGEKTKSYLRQINKMLIGIKSSMDRKDKRTQDSNFNSRISVYIRSKNM